MDDDRTNRLAASEKFCDFQTSARIGRDAGHGMQIMIQRNQACFGQMWLALRDHRRGIAPEAQLELGTES